AERLVAALLTGDNEAELVPELDPEVEGGPDPLCGQRQAVARRIADEEDPVLRALPELVGDPVALIANRGAVQVIGQQHGGVLDVEARVEGADADPLLVMGGKPPAVACGDVAPVDPDLEIVGTLLRMDLQPAREWRVWRLVAAVGSKDAPPAERIDDQRGRDVAAVGVDGLAGAAVHLG